MRRLVEFPLQGGGEVLVDTSTGPVTRSWGDRRVTKQADQTFEAAIGRIEPAARALLSRLRDLPDEVAVEFGLQLSVEAGAFIAAASSTANFKVSITWRSRSTPGASLPSAGAG
jgi:hypothetical protein